MESVTITHLTKKYGEFTAVKDLDLAIKRGEILGLLGPNGAGKTTTIQCICQLSSITSGSIVVNGFDVEHDSVMAKHQIGLSPQEVTADPFFSLWEILIYQAGYFGIWGQEAKSLIEERLKEFNLWEKRDVDFRSLSGGMKRKVSLIKATLHDPPILILDEPTAGLDIEARHDLWAYIRKLSEKGITIILTTHYIEEAERLCERIGIISKGRLLKLERKEELIDEFSQNAITFFFEKDIKLPKEIAAFPHTMHERRVEIFVKKREQHTVLRKLLDLFNKHDMSVTNFTIQEDSLENIFRRFIEDDR